jgi:hypothetical protein
MVAATVSAIGTMVDDALDGWYERERMRRQAAADDPCYWYVDTLNWTMGAGGLQMVLRNLEDLCVELSTSGNRAVQWSLAAFGEPTTGVDRRGARSFARYLTQEGVIDLEWARVLHGPNPFAQMILDGIEASFVDRLNPNVTARVHDPVGPANINKGVKLFRGAYLYKAGVPTGSAMTTDDEINHFENGYLVGSHVRQAFWNWRDEIKSKVSGNDHPWWRESLDELVGNPMGDRLKYPTLWYRIWKPGVEPEEGSKLDMTRLANADLNARMVEMEADCDEMRRVKGGILDPDGTKQGDVVVTFEEEKKSNLGLLLVAAGAYFLTQK